MPAGPVLVLTKLHPPPVRPGHVARPRLVERLEAAAAGRTTLVQAPAGGGKTSLVAEWLASSRRPAAWVSLDPDDEDPARLWAHVIEALRGAGVGVPASVGAALAAPGARPTEAALPQLVNALVAHGAPLVLVLDDVHLLRGEPALEGLAFLVERLPPGVHLVLCGRHEPPAPFPAPRLRARGDLADVTTDDLRLSVAEASTLLNDGLGLGLAPADVERLQARTEGWAAGLYLAALSLRARPGAIDDITGGDRHLADFLTAEVLAGEPPEVGDLLVRSAVLSRLCGPLCDHVLQTSGSSQLLERLERSNLLVVPLDNRRLWFRFHHLFAELLRHRLEQAPAEEVRALHLRAADWWAAHDEPAEAIAHALAADDAERAARLIEGSWNRYLQRGQLTTVLGWLDALPTEVLDAHPQLVLGRAWATLDAGDHAAGARLAEALRSCELAAREGALPVPAGAAMLQAVHRYCAGDLGAAAALSREALELGVGSSPWAAVARATLGCALLLLGRETDEADDALRAAIDAAAPGENMIAALRALGARALLRLELGDPGGARALAARAVAVRDEQGLAEYPWAGLASLAQARLAEHDGDLDGAAAAASRAALLAERGRVLPELAAACVTGAGVATARGRSDEAAALARRAREALAAAPDPGVLAHALSAAERRAGPARTAAPGTDPLTDRELGVLRMLASSLTAREVADALYVSPNTLKTHTRTIYRKLGASGRADAVSRARAAGLL